jgi:hypothetical protein
MLNSDSFWKASALHSKQKQLQIYKLLNLSFFTLHVLPDTHLSQHSDSLTNCRTLCDFVQLSLTKVVQGFHVVQLIILLCISCENLAGGSPSHPAGHLSCSTAAAAAYAPLLSPS